MGPAQVVALCICVFSCTAGSQDGMKTTITGQSETAVLASYPTSFYSFSSSYSCDGLLTGLSGRSVRDVVFWRQPVLGRERRLAAELHGHGSAGIDEHGVV